MTLKTIVSSYFNKNQTIIHRDTKLHGHYAPMNLPHLLAVQNPHQILLVPICT